MRSVLLLLTAAAIGSAQTPAVFKEVFTGITTAQASGAVRNAGQAVHILTVLFPSATVDVTGFVIRLEGSYNPEAGTPTWIPISEDITSAASNGTFAYAITRANGVYPAVRVRLLTSVSSPLTAHYSGSQYPIGQFIFDSGRFLAEAKSPLVAMWALCAGTNCSTGSNLTAQYIVPAALSLRKCFIAAKTAPTGSALVVDILKNGSSIFGATKLQLASGAAYNTQSTFSSTALAEGDLLTIDITAIGSTSPGKDVSVSCRMQ